MELIEGLKLSIKGLGCAAGGSNTVTRLMNEGVVGAELIACNTDARHLLNTHAHKKLLIGKRLTRGLGAAASPTWASSRRARARRVQEGAAGRPHRLHRRRNGRRDRDRDGAHRRPARQAVRGDGHSLRHEAVQGRGQAADGGGGHGAGAPELRGRHGRRDINDRLLEMAPKLRLTRRSLVLDELLMDSMKSIIELITKPGLVNLDYNDLKDHHRGRRRVHDGLGESDAPGGERVDDAVNAVLNCRCSSTTCATPRAPS